MCIRDSLCIKKVNIRNKTTKFVFCFNEWGRISSLHIIQLARTPTVFTLSAKIYMTTICFYFRVSFNTCCQWDYALLNSNMAFRLCKIWHFVAVCFKELCIFNILLNIKYLSVNLNILISFNAFLSCLCRSAFLWFNFVFYCYIFL